MIFFFFFGSENLFNSQVHKGIYDVEDSDRANYSKVRVYSRKNEFFDGIRRIFSNLIIDYSHKDSSIPLKKKSFEILFVPVKKNLGKNSFFRFSKKKFSSIFHCLQFFFQPNLISCLPSKLTKAMVFIIMIKRLNVSR